MIVGDVLADMKAEYADREDIASEEDEDDEVTAKSVRMHAQDTQDSGFLFFSSFLFFFFCPHSSTLGNLPIVRSNLQNCDNKCQMN